MLKLELLRRQAGLTQAALGRETGVNQTTISQIERGRVNASDSELRRFADVLGFSEDPSLLAESCDVA
jgi:transcriptional regulator with XRE-family HTH domain